MNTGDPYRSARKAVISDKLRKQGRGEEDKGVCKAIVPMNGLITGREGQKVNLLQKGNAGAQTKG